MAEEQIPGALQGALQAALGISAPSTSSESKPVENKPAEAEAPSKPEGKPAEAPPVRPQANRESRPPREGGGPPRQGQRPGAAGGGERREGRGGPPERSGDRGGERSPDRGGERGGDRRPVGGERRFDGPPDIELEKLIGDSLYLDNQAHMVVSRIRDMDSGTRSQLRRLYSAVRRATRAAESERQHEFVMLRARLAYTIARHGLRSLDQLERLLLQVTRKNEARGYERFRDLFEAIVAYNE